ncbi:MAG TPA: GH92 family glycosyl hydrolase, partial [Bacteroidota bacterium]|nr:GH92 family glycosyl hydrolase [Bacteroidota bacterium]
NAWQYSFFVPHDIEGLIEEYGGKQRFEKKLDELFFGSSQTSGRQQADITGMIGQYAQGNEPSHHVAYLYNEVGAPWKTQMIVRRVLDSLYSSRADGLCGNDDCGQLSAWYVMSALGLYPVTPGIPEYSIGSPLFEKATIHLENGRNFVIQARNNSKDAKYVQSIILNGKPYDKLYLKHEDLMRGGRIVFEMGKDPNDEWRAVSNLAPKTIPGGQIVSVPYIETRSQSLVDSLTLELKTNTKNASIFYKLIPFMTESVEYTRPIIITEACSLSAFAAKEGLTKSRSVEAIFRKRNRTGEIRLGTRFSPQYTGGGDQALIDEIRGGTDFRVGGWQGYEQDDVEATVDLGKTERITEVSLGSLQDNNAWIFFPTKVMFTFSEGGREFRNSIEATNDISPEDSRAMTKEFRASVNIVARFVQVHAKNIGVCPPWHKGSGKKAWLFVDEISITTR